MFILVLKLRIHPIHLYTQTIFTSQVTHMTLNNDPKILERYILLYAGGALIGIT